MDAPVTSRVDHVTWMLFGAGLLLVLYLELLPALLAGLLVYALVNALVPRLRVRALGREGPQLVAVSLIASGVVALMALAGVCVASFLRGSGESVPALIQRMAEIIESSRARLPPWMLEYVPEDANALRKTLVDWLRANADVFQMAGKGLGRALAHILVGMVIGALLSLESAVGRRMRGPLAEAIAERAQRLNRAFHRIVFAQLWISAINTLLTSIYLLIVLRLFGVELPFTKTLIMVTFIAGLVPILGNLVSNTVIVTVSLSQSLFVALASLVFLVIVHKLEYFLNARIMGGHIRASVWEMLLAMLIMEAAFGLAGLIAAPIYYAYLKNELREEGLI